MIMFILIIHFNKCVSDISKKINELISEKNKNVL